MLKNYKRYEKYLQEHQHLKQLLLAHGFNFNKPFSIDSIEAKNLGQVWKYLKNKTFTGYVYIINGFGFYTLHRFESFIQCMGVRHVTAQTTIYIVETSEEFPTYTLNINYHHELMNARDDKFSSYPLNYISDILNATYSKTSYTRVNLNKIPSKVKQYFDKSGYYIGGGIYGSGYRTRDRIRYYLETRWLIHEKNKKR